MPSPPDGIRSHASVAVTQGLMELMDDEELEGVIAHELSHVRNYDILTSSIAATIAGAITWVAQMGRWGMMFGGWGGGRDNEREGGGIAAILMLILAPLAAMLLQLGISRQREYQADASGAQNGRASIRFDPRARKAGRLQQANPDGYFSFHVGPLHRRSADVPANCFPSLFSTHPPLEDRIARLRDMTVTR